MYYKYNFVSLFTTKKEKQGKKSTKDNVCVFCAFVF